ncbi:unnamed protein product [Sphagnum jensenii]|uniref:Uncharacterized protein n=1 Tax=Sphagnum jensenii TaxID=128206 RepID=A0ABP1AHH2_9BRYO
MRSSAALGKSRVVSLANSIYIGVRSSHRTMVLTCLIWPHPSTFGPPTPFSSTIVCICQRDSMPLPNVAAPQGVQTQRPKSLRFVGGGGFAGSGLLCYFWAGARQPGSTQRNKLGLSSDMLALVMAKRVIHLARLSCATLAMRVAFRQANRAVKAAVSHDAQAYVRQQVEMAERLQQAGVLGGGRDFTDEVREVEGVLVAEAGGIGARE